MIPMDLHASGRLSCKPRASGDDPAVDGQAELTVE